MAEHVQAALDQMVPALQDLQKRGVFSGEEIHAIVSRRRESEYLLRRRNPRQADFLRYIQAETALEKLRHLRVTRLQREARQSSKQEQQQQQQTKHIGDKHIVQHIHLLWTRTLRKYGRTCPDLYLEYANFCKETKSMRKLAACYTQAMQYHPGIATFWIEAASHEFFANGSMQNARVILQRGLRLHSSSIDLWLQSFVLELHFVQKLYGRRVVLLQNDDDNGSNNEQDENRHKIALLVYDNAIQSAVDSTEFRLKFLHQCTMFPATIDLQDAIMDSIERDYGASETAWIARALYQKEKQQKAEEARDCSEEPQTKRQRTDQDSDPVLDTIRQACQKLRTEEMFLQALGFLDSYAESQDDDDSSAGRDDDSEQQETSELDQQQRQEAAIKLIGELLEDASQAEFYSARLAIRYANFLAHQQQDMDGAIGVLKDYVLQCSNKSKNNACPATVWIRWAGLVLEQGENNDDDAVKVACRILVRASKAIPMHSPDHMLVLLQLFGGRLVVAERARGGDDIRGCDLADLFQQILLLAPGFRELDDIEDPAFDNVNNAPTACLQYLLNMLNTSNASEFRKVYDAVLYKSTLVDQLTETDSEVMQSFMDKSIAAEHEQKSKQQQGSKSKQRECRKRLSRLYDTAIKMFRGTPLAAMYRQRRDEELLYNFRSPPSGVKHAPVTAANAVPSFDVKSADFDFSALERAYKDFQVVHLRNASKLHGHKECDGKLGWEGIGNIFQQLNAKDKESWCMETKTGTASLSASQFLARRVTRRFRAYCSFLIQNDAEVYDNTISRLPFQEFRGTDWKYEPTLWIFFGRNPLGNANLDGRPEHTDSVSNDGTWHYQLSGVKKWFIRPTSHLKQQIPSLSENDMQFEVNCVEGDIIVLNTRLWFHRTVIPPQSRPSVSYARDFSHRKMVPPGTKIRDGMMNVDGLYATNEIESGTIIFTEADMPDCELHRSSTPNCEVIELEDGKQAVVSTTTITAGDFFCVPDSDEDSSCDVFDEDD